MIALILSAVLSFTACAEAGLPRRVREDLILPPLLNAVIILITGGLELGGWTNAAPSSLLLDVALVAGFFGMRAKQAGRAEV